MQAPPPSPDPSPTGDTLDTPATSAPAPGPTPPSSPPSSTPAAAHGNAPPPAGTDAAIPRAPASPAPGHDHSASDATITPSAPRPPSPPSATPPPPAPPRRLPREAATGSLLLVLVCLALGISLSWALHERQQRRDIASRLDSAHTRTALADARSGELRRLLAQPRTRLIHLRGTGAADGRWATIAWNPVQREAILLVDPADAGPYRLLARTADTTIDLAHFTTPRRVEPMTPAPDAAQLELHPLPSTGEARFVGSW